MKKKDQCNTLSIVLVNSDMSSKGGISSVIQSITRTNRKIGSPVRLILLKTSHYKEKELFAEISLLIYSIAKFISILLFNKIDIVHIHSSAFLSFYRKSIFFLLAKIFGKKTIFHLHSSKFREFFITPNRFQNAFIRLVFKHSNLVIALCHDWETKLKHRYTFKSITTVHNPISIQDYTVTNKEQIADETLRVLFLAFLIPSKGVMDIISIAKRLKESGDHKVEVIIGGKGELEPTLLDAIEHHQLQNIIHFKGWVSGDYKTQLLASSDVFFLPSYNEGMPISILEAMCNGLAIVATAIAGVPDLVKNGLNGYMKKPGDIDGFYEVLTQLANDRTKALEMGKESLRLVRKFDSTIILDKWIDIYRQLAAGVSR